MKQGRSWDLNLSLADSPGLLPTTLTGSVFQAGQWAAHSWACPWAEMEELRDRDSSPPPSLSAVGEGDSCSSFWNSVVPREDGFWVLVQPTDCLCGALWVKRTPRPWQRGDVEGRVSVVFPGVTSGQLV